MTRSTRNNNKRKNSQETIVSQESSGKQENESDSGESKSKNLKLLRDAASTETSTQPEIMNSTDKIKERQVEDVRNVEITTEDINNNAHY